MHGFRGRVRRQDKHTRPHDWHARHSHPHPRPGNERSLHKPTTPLPHHHRHEATLRGGMASPPLPVSAPPPSPPPSSPPPAPLLPPLAPLGPGQTLATGDLTRQRLQQLARRARCVVAWLSCRWLPHSLARRPRPAYGTASARAVAMARWLSAAWGVTRSGKMRDTTIFLTFANSAFRCPNPSAPVPTKGKSSCTAVGFNPTVRRGRTPAQDAGRSLAR